MQLHDTNLRLQSNKRFWENHSNILITYEGSKSSDIHMWSLAHDFKNRLPAQGQECIKHVRVCSTDTT